MAGGFDGFEVVSLPKTDDGFEVVSTPSTEGDFMRGAKVALGQTPALAKGMIGAIGATGEQVFGEGGVSTAIRDWGLNGYKEGMDKLQPLQHENDDVTKAWDKAKQGDIGALVDWVQYGLGYGIGQLGESALVGVIGGMAGSAVGPEGAVGGAAAGLFAKTGVKALAGGIVEKMVAKEAARIAEKSGMEATAEVVTKQATKNVAQAIGAGAALGGYNEMMEVGSIMPDAVEQAKGRDFSGSDLAKVWGWGTAAALTESASDLLGLGAVAGRIKVPGAGGRIARGMTGAGIGGGLEGAQEGVQTWMEWMGAQKDTSSPEFKNDLINSIAMGALPGAITGGAAGAIHRPAITDVTDPNKTTDEAIQAANDFATAGNEVQSVATLLSDADANYRSNLAAQGIATQTGMINDQRIANNLSDAEFATGQERMAAENAKDRTIAATPSDEQVSAAIQGQAQTTNLLTNQTGRPPMIGFPNGGPVVETAERAALHQQRMDERAASQANTAAQENLSQVQSEEGEARPATIGKRKASAVTDEELAQIIADPAAHISTRRAAIMERNARVAEATPTATGTGGSNEITSTMGGTTVTVPNAPAAKTNTVAQAYKILQNGEKLPSDKFVLRNVEERIGTEAMEQVRQFATGRALMTKEQAKAAEKLILTDGRVEQQTKVQPTTLSQPVAQQQLADNEVGQFSTNRQEQTSGTTPTQTVPQQAQQSAPNSHPDAVAIARAISTATGGKTTPRITLENVNAEMGKTPLQRGTVSMVKGIGKLFKKRIIFFSSPDVGTEGAVFQEKGDNRIYINVNSNVDALRVVGHELMHKMKQQAPKAYANLRTALSTVVTNKEALREMYRDYNRANNLTDEQVDAELDKPGARENLIEEMLSDLGGNRFAEAEFWSDLFTRIEQREGREKAKGIIARLREAMLMALSQMKRLFTGSAFKADEFAGVADRLDQVRHALVEAYATYLEDVRADGTMDEDAAMAGDVRASETPRRDDFTNQNISTRWPTSKKLSPAPSVHGPVMITDLDTLKQDQAQYQKAVEAILEEPGMHSADIVSGSLDEKADHVIERMKSNLLWLYDQIPEAIRQRSKLWYDGARKIAEIWAERYEVSESQAAGMLAVLSPQKDWFMNVTMAERVLDIMHGKMNHKFDARMDAAAFGFLTKESVKDDPDAQKNLRAYEAVKGKTLAEVCRHHDLRQMSVWIRAYDEAYHDAKHAIVTPEGNFVEDKTTVSGDPTMRAWGDFTTPGKAASIYLNGTPENINKMLGQEHKVRNFYNNIYSPGDPRFTTIDTHAVAADMLRALAGADKPVADNFGKTGGTNVTGLSGTYALHYEAYRRAAEERGVLPREMQSITWEAVRGLFTEGFKGKKENVRDVDAIWSKVDSGELTIDQARDQILERAGGIEHPDWWNEGNTEYKEVLRDKSYVQHRGAFHGAKVVFEVAPDPRNTEQKARWDALPGDVKQDISHKVTWKIAARALASFGDENMKGELHQQSGGWLDDTNPSLSIWFNKRAAASKINQFARMLGFALNQMSMMRTSNRPFKGMDGKTVEQSGAIGIDLPAGTDVDLLYRKIRGIVDSKGKPYVSGHTTTTEQMVIINDEKRISTDELGKKINDLLGDEYHVHGGHIYAEFLSKGKNNYALPPRNAKDSPESSLRARSDQLRAEAGVLLEQLIGEAEQQGRSDAAGSAVAGAGDAGTLSQSPQRQGAVAGEGVHYSREQRQSLSSSFFGTGLKGAELQRVMQAKDPRIKQRLYFYVNTGRGIHPEAGVGAHAHKVPLDNLYDIQADALDLFPAYRGDLNAIESAMLDAGFDGYMGQDSGVAVLLGPRTVTNVEYLGARIKPTVDRAGQAEPSAYVAAQRAIAARKDLPSGQMTGAEWKDRVPEMDLSHLEDGEYYSKSALAKKPTAKFSQMRAVDTTSPEFRAWFKGSKVVDADGKPLVVYHGTIHDFSSFNAGQYSGLIFLTPSKEFANDFAARYQTAFAKGEPFDPNVMPVYVSASNIFDFRNPRHVRELVSELKSRGIKFNAAGIGRGDWDALELSGRPKVMQELGFDGLYIKEHGLINIAVFSPTQIKSAISNTGEFSDTNPDIRMSPARDLDFTGNGATLTPSPFMTEEEIDEAQRLFLSAFPADVRTYRRSSGTAKAARVASERATLAIGKSATAPRKVEGVRMGPFSGYETEASIERDFFGNDQLVINLWGKEQLEQDLWDDPALKMTVSQDGDFSIYGPPSKSNTFKEFKKRGWAEFATDPAGEIHTIDGESHWTRLTGSDEKQAINLLGDAHARLRNWTGKSHVGMHWVRTTGATGGEAGKRGAMFFSPARAFNQVDTSSPEFKKWFKDSKVVDADGKPLVVYHGTPVDNEGRFITNELGLIFVTPDKGFANDYTTKWQGEDKTDYKKRLKVIEKDGLSPQNVPLYASVQNLFDYNNESHVRKLLAFGRKNGWIENGELRFSGRFDGDDWTGDTRLLYEGDWTAYENREVVDALKDMGFDGMKIMELGINNYAVFSPTQIKSAISNTGEFSDTNPDIRYSTPRIIGDSGRQYTPAQRAMFGNVGREVDQLSVAEKLKAWASQKWAQGIVDQFAPVKDLSEKAYTLMRLSKGATGAMEAFMHHGKLSLRDGAYDSDTSGGVMQNVFLPLGKETTDFLYWVAGNRAERLSAEDREHLFRPQDIAAAKSLADGKLDFDYVLANGQTTRDRRAAYADSAKKFSAANKNVMDMAEQSGLIDKDGRQYWEHEFYVPFYRVSEDDAVRGANVKSGVIRQEAFKKLKGGTEGLNDLLSNTLMNWAHLIDASAKNRAAQATLEAAEKLGVARPAVHGEKKTVWFMRKGEKAEYKVDDPYLLTAINGLDYAGLRGPMMDALSRTKHWLTIGVTASPFFKIRNLIRDSVQAIATSDLGYNPVSNVVKGWKLTDRASQEYVSALAGGGLIRFGTMLEGSEAARTRQLIKQGAKDAHILDNESKIRAFYDKYLEPGITAYNELGNRGEEINRMSLYDQLIKQGKDHATASLMARDLMDFSMQGSFTSIRFLTQVVPFMNARLQGLYKLGRAGKEDPAKMAVVTGMVALASLALLAAYHDDDDWKRREDWDRNNYWWFKFGGTSFRIPKPFEIGAIATLAERSAEFIFDKEMTGKRFRQVTQQVLSDQLSMNPIPQLVKPIIDVYSNKDAFTGRPIETMSMEKLDPQQRYNARTWMPARYASQAVGGAMSPVQIEHLVRGYFSWLGAFVVGGADMAVRAASSEPTRPTLDYWKFASGGMVSELDGASSRYVSQMYDQAKELEQAYGTWRQLIKEGKISDAKEYRADHLEELKKYPQVENIKRAEAKLNERIRMIERSNKSPDEKKAMIEAIKKQQDKLARRIA